MITIRLWLGEQDGKSYTLPDDIDQIRTDDAFDINDPPLHIWVITAAGERELSHYKAERIKEPEGLHEHFMRCAYRLNDLVDSDGELMELHYERDVYADRQAIR